MAAHAFERMEFSRRRVLVVSHESRGKPSVSLRVERDDRELIDESVLAAVPYVTYLSPPLPYALRCLYAIKGVPGDEFDIAIEVKQEGATIARNLVGIVPSGGEEERLLVLSGKFEDDIFRMYQGQLPPEIAERLPKDAGVRRIWYATNRKPTDQNGNLLGYSAERDSGVMHYGVCDVRIPESHALLHRLLAFFKPSTDVAGLQTLTSMRVQEYFAAMSSELSALAPTERHAVVFIHGYNVSFEQAAIRCAQLGADLDLPGIMGFFSWPSRGRLRGYIADEASVEAAERPITAYLVDMATRSGAAHVHIIAHSMGNRALLRAVDRIASTAQRQAGVRFRQIILAAPDVDQDTFKNLASAYSGVSDRTTLYVSARDRAVEASRWLHGFPRAGLEPPLVVADGIDTINVTNIDVTLLGHGYVSDCRSIVKDIYALLRNGTPPGERERRGVRRAVTQEGSGYWEFANDDLAARHS